MDRRSRQRDTRRRVLSEVLKTLRAHRGLRSIDVAARMGLEPRTYERFEAGSVRLDLERLLNFAEVTDSDPLAILAALHLGRPELARLCADNKLLLIQALALERFAAREGENVRRLDGATLIDTFEAAFDQLSAGLLARDARRPDDPASEPPDPS